MNTPTVSSFGGWLRTINQAISQGDEVIPLPRRRTRSETVPVRTCEANSGGVAPKYSARPNIGKPLIR